MNSAAYQGWGEIAPLPHWSRETIDSCFKQLTQIQQPIQQIEWQPHTCLAELSKLSLLPAVTFGLESALLSLLDPVDAITVPASALLVGSAQEILTQAEQRKREGFTSAKLKVSALSDAEAALVIRELKELFSLRIDVNRAWSTSAALRFFEQFPLDTFDYVEEPFQNPLDLAQFPHPLAVDESFPHPLSLEQLEALPTLKALVYKPTIQGGLTNCAYLQKWAAQRGVSLVLSSSFESDLGLAMIARMAHRMSLTSPIGIGTFHHLRDHICNPPLQFSHSMVHISALSSSREQP